MIINVSSTDGDTEVAMGSTETLPDSATPPEELPVREPRARALLTGSISGFDNSLSTPCIVNNISGSGARITLSPAVPVAGEFKVCIPQRGLNRTARLVWRKGDQLGVVFVVEPGSRLSLDENEKDRRIRALEIENANLRAEIGILKNDIYRREDF
jgi:hypothetical protein